jgi:tetratricopeptide (TPR) repeat protein
VCFQEGRYSEGLATVNRLLLKNPTNSSLLLNRALFHSQMNEDQYAMVDIRSALVSNPHNYLAYFNMFSLQYRNHDDLNAFSSLCCSLSCLHLLKAKKAKNLANADKSIKYSSNNVEAHTLKGLLLLEKTQYL